MVIMWIIYGYYMVIIWLMMVNNNLVGGFNLSEKYESQLGVLFPIYGKIKAMFQTTKQDIINLPKGEMGTTSYPAQVANSGLS